MNLRSIDLNLLLVFDAIQREGSISQAARQLHLSQPAVSNALARLREKLGDPLFERQAKGMRPTARGRQLAEPIRQALTLLESGLRENTGFDFAHSKREYVVAAEDYGECVVLPGLMAQLAAQAPHMRIRVRAEAAPALGAALRDGVVDMALDYFAPTDPDMLYVRVLTDSLISLARRDHPLVAERLSLDHFLALQHVVLDASANVRPMIDLALAKRGLQRSIAVRVPHFLSMPLLVRSTDMLCSLPRRMAHPFAGPFGLQLHAVPLRLPQFPVFLVWHRALDHDPGHQWLRQQIMAHGLAL